MKYEDALQAWGRKRLNAQIEEWNESAQGRTDWFGRPLVVEGLIPEDWPVTVKFHFYEGCEYSSYTIENAEAYVEISSTATRRRIEIPPEDFDFAEILGEIVEAGGGEVTG